MSAGSQNGKSTVVVVVIGRGKAATTATLRAVAAQSHAPDRIIVASSAAAGIEEARPDAAGWIWLIDGRVVPEPAALEALLEAAAAWRNRPLRLLASVLVDGQGNLLERLAPLPQTRDPDLAVEAFQRRTSSIRAAGYGSLLVCADGLAQVPPPAAGSGGELVWSARLLASGLGLLVPGSVAIREEPISGDERLGFILGWLRLLGSGALPASEKPWVGFLYFERALGLIIDWARDRRRGGSRPTGRRR